MFFAIITELAVRSYLCRVPHARVWSDYYRFPINIVLVSAAYLLENAILVLSRVGHLHPILKPHRGAFAAFPKQNDKCPTGHGHAWNCLSHTFVLLCCRRESNNLFDSPIKFKSSCRSWENMLNFKHFTVLPNWLEMHQKLAHPRCENL